jgi:sulfite exporter TauE/SafE
MIWIDERIADLSGGASLGLILLVAVLLGLRHATDPDHLAAVTTLAATDDERMPRRAGLLGLAWGVGHGLTLMLFGLPIVLLQSRLPFRLQQLVETVIAGLIVALALRLLYRWRAGAFHIHEHLHGDGRAHVHLHSHTADGGHAHHSSAETTRTPLAAFGIGLAHGVGGSGAVGALLLGSLRSPALAAGALVVLAACTAFSMWAVTFGFGSALASKPIRNSFNRLAPTLAVLALAFGIWYGTTSWQPL